MQTEMKVNFVCHTDGKGFWSREKTKVNITKLSLHTWDYEGENDRGNLHVFFDCKDWKVEQNGLIYTDRLFEKELSKELKKIGLRGCVSYSEQGMQGQYYVDFDADGAFIKSFFKLTGIDIKRCKLPKATPKVKSKKGKKNSQQDEADKKLQVLKDALNDYLQFLGKSTL